METNCTYIPYKSTGYFSKLVLDYIDQKEELQSFYNHPPTLDGIKAAIEERKKAPNHRQLLVEELRKQYEGIELTELQDQHLSNLTDQNTFTICTAHQPNIFTGHLYFIYKILHAIKLAETLSTQLPAYKFVPVFYMGSEDADLDELGHINLNGVKLEWKTKQTGAVGRMLVDKDFIELIERMSGELSVLPFGKELMEMFRASYTLGLTIQQATLLLVNCLFSQYGLLVLVPDNANLKRPFNEIVKRELTENFSYPIVQRSAEQLNKEYKVQAGGREINLFYLLDDLRERIISQDGNFRAATLEWNTKEMLAEVDEHPERFSANVILRGVFQEMILPNVAFIGGGGEIAYWMELKDVFESCLVPFPVLVLRNSFLLFDQESKVVAKKLGFELQDLFQNEHTLTTHLVARHSTSVLNVHSELAELDNLYEVLRQKASDIDVTLSDHVLNLRQKAKKSIRELEKKMLRSETKKFEAEIRKLRKIRNHLFPNNSLQERVDNFSSYYAAHGPQWLDQILKSSLSLEQQFGLVQTL